MTRIPTLAVLGAVVALVTACGTGGAQSGGPLTLPTTEGPAGTTTTAPSPIPTTQGPSDPGQSTTTTAPNGPSPTTSTVPAQPTTVVVYYLDTQGATAVPVERTVTTAGVARAAVEALISGPSASEASRGLHTAFPADTLLLGVTVESGTASVDLSREFEAGGGSTAIIGRLAQLVYTLTEFPSVDRVRLLLDGERVEHFSGEGFLVGEPLTRADFTGAVTIGDAPDGGNVVVWGADDLPPADDSAPSTRRVVLVAADDTLNVRATAGTSGQILGALEPGVAVRATGAERAVGNSTWVEIETPAGRGWVNGFYLTPTGTADANELEQVVEELAAAFAAGDDFRGLISSRGLWVAHHATPIRFTQGELDGVLTSATTYRWGSNALEADSPEITPRTFKQAIADRFVGAVDDDDSTIAVGEVIEGPNGRIPEYAIPVEFQGFPFATVFDPGDNPDYGGLDWISWVVSFVPEDGGHKVIGLTIDEWAP